MIRNVIPAKADNPRLSLACLPSKLLLTLQSPAQKSAASEDPALPPRQDHSLLCAHRPLCNYFNLSMAMLS